MPSICSLCKALCCSTYTITVTSFDVLEIAQKAKKRPESFAEIVPLRLLSFDNDTVLECYEKGQMHEHVLALKSNPCIFLKGTTCMIHSFAPLVCRAYPYRSDGSMHPRALCPLLPRILFKLKGMGISPNLIKQRTNAYKAIVRKWNRKKGKKEECLDFLLSESKKLMP
ncbi:MAG: YkgJ family cysteine cluster protein [Candidatus Anstonellales archaeon]